MSEPALYHWYDRDEAIAFFGLAKDARLSGNGDWILFPATSVCFATVGANASNFRAATKFVWMSGERARWGPFDAFLPEEVHPKKARGFRRYLFVRPPDAQKYRYLGELGPTYSFGYATRDSCGHADFDLSPALPSAIGQELGVFDGQDDDHAGVDEALARLRGDTSVEERLAILTRLIEYWYGPVGPHDGYTEEELAGLRMPFFLREWYRWAGKRKEVMAGQNFLLMPKNEKGKSYGGLYVEDDRLVFYHENQCVYRWATLEDGDDPPVFGRYEKTDPWTPEGMTVSEHLILACLFDGILAVSKFGASTAWLEEEKVEEIIRKIPPVSIGPWRWSGPMRFYAGNGVFLYTALNGQHNGKRGMSIWIGAKTEHPLQFLKAHVGKDWEYVAI